MPVHPESAYTVAPTLPYWMVAVLMAVSAGMLPMLQLPARAVQGKDESATAPLHYPLWPALPGIGRSKAKLPPSQL